MFVSYRKVSQVRRMAALLCDGLLKKNLAWANRVVATKRFVSKRQNTVL